jgi:hypothetical protein
MTAQTHNAGREYVATRPSRRLSTETKAAVKTTEFFVFIAAVAAVLIASQIVDGFEADRAWLYVTALAVGYMLSRGLAKSGSRDYYDDDSDDRRGNHI